MPIFSSNGLPNLGGPGWFGDIFDTSLVIEGGEKVSTAAGAESFDVSKQLSGKLIVGPPEGRSITHDGIEIILKSVAGAKPVEKPDLAVMEKRWKLLDAGSIDEAIEIPFDMDLIKIADLRESFDSRHGFNLKHTIGFQIWRPWWTFTVTGEEEIELKSYGHGATEAAEPGALPQPEQTSLSVEDFGGSATFDHGSATYMCDGAVEGAVALSGMAEAVPLARVTVMLGRTDTCGDYSCDEECRVHHLHDNAASPLAADCQLPVSFKLGEPGAEPFPLAELAPTMPRLKPSDKPAYAEQEVEVCYWLRLQLEGVPEGNTAPKKWWSTHPVVLVRPTKVAGQGLATGV